MARSIPKPLEQLGTIVLDAIAASRATALATREAAVLGRPLAEPPVVARMLVEIRSDGTRTIARGALEDHLTGERHDIEARGSTPAALAISLVARLTTLPVFGQTIARALFGEPKHDGERD